MNITTGQIVSIIALLATATTLILNSQKILKRLGDIFKSLAKKFKDFANKDKQRIASLEKKIGQLELENERQSGIINTLERESRIMDILPEGCELFYNNILLHKKTNKQYCWNCWNKINGRERRVLEGDEYSVFCPVCNIHTTLKEFIPPPPAPEEPLI